jgi:hypothetical protein
MPYVLQPVNVPGDGNCFYRAVCMYINDINSQVEDAPVIRYTDLRRKVCAYIHKHANDIAAQTKGAMAIEDIRDLAMKQSVPGEFTDNEIIQFAVMAILPIKLRIFFTCGGDIEYEWNPRGVKVQDACNLMCENAHFQYLRCERQ